MTPTEILEALNVYVAEHKQHHIVKHNEGEYAYWTIETKNGRRFWNAQEKQWQTEPYGYTTSDAVYNARQDLLNHWKEYLPQATETKDGAITLFVIQGKALKMILHTLIQIVACGAFFGIAHYFNSTPAGWAAFIAFLYVFVRFKANEKYLWTPEDTVKYLQQRFPNETP